MSSSALDVLDGQDLVVRPFTSRSTKTARENLADFIAGARSRNPLGIVDWDAVRWDFPKLSRASSASEGGLVFSLRSANTSDPGVMPEPFMSFVKAIICAYNTRKSTLYAVGQSQTLIAAGRLLYHQLRDRGGDPCTLCRGDFDAAANQAKASMGAGAANVGSKLAIIAAEMDRHGMTAGPLIWKTTVKREHKHDRVGPEALRRRHDKLPSVAALDALADISARTDLDDRDLVVQRAIDLLLCGGFRLNEVLTLPRNTLVEAPVLDEDGRQMLDRFGNPAVDVGLRYWPEKGGHEVSQIKWLPSVTIDLARRAVADVLRITEPFAEIAVHQRRRRGSTLLGLPWDDMHDDDLLTPTEIAHAVGLNLNNPPVAGRKFAMDNGLDIVPGRNRKNQPIRQVRVGSLRQHLWDRSVHGNVLNGTVGQLDVSDCLFTVPVFFVKRSWARGTRGTVQLLSDAVLQVYLVSQANGIQPSIFERLGYLDEDGQPIRLNSHQFRHLLNTLAAEGNVSELEIARWMGRKQVVHNSAYQHVTPTARAEDLRQRLGGGASIGPVADHAITIQDPVRRADFIFSTTTTAHVTDIGFCVHPWDALPCREHGACSTCSEHRFLKGDPASRARAAADLEQTEAMLLIAQAEAEADDDAYGADNWLEAHETTAASLRAIIATHDDLSIPDGTLVQLPKHATVNQGANDA